MDLQRLFSNWKDVHEFAAGGVIFREGDPADAMFVILDGEVDLKLRGRELATEVRGGMIGITAHLEGGTRNATATARTDVKLARLDREQTSRTMDDNLEFAKQVIAVLAQRLRDVDRFITKNLDTDGPPDSAG